MLQYVFFPGGKRKALTMSYDDGSIHDRRLVSIFNQFRIKGTFHLNSGLLGDDVHIGADEVRLLYAGHEVSAHTVTHPNLSRIPKEEIAWQILEDRRRLEQLAGYPVRGMSYPNGDCGRCVVRVLPAFGIEYARTVRSQPDFAPPEDFLLWNPTCHHGEALREKLDAFKNAPQWQQMPVFYVWGHSYEFDQGNNWELMEGFCKEASGLPDVWYATNIMIVDYLNALFSLRCSADRTMAMNPSAISVWVDADGKAVEIKPGELKLFTQPLKAAF